MVKRIEKHWEILENMSDEKLKELINSFLIKMFGQGVIKDTEYFETWFKRFREGKDYLNYMDHKSRAIFFSLLSMEVEKR